MRWKLGLAIAAAMLLAVPVVLAASTVAPTGAQRAGVLKAFGDPKAGWSCLTVRLAAADRRFATVRFRRVSRCTRWAFDGVNVAERGAGGSWRMVFEGSSYRCPRPRIPLAVQRDLGICPAR